MEQFVNKLDLLEQVCQFRSFGPVCQFHSFSLVCEFDSFRPVCQFRSFRPVYQFHLFGPVSQFDSFGLVCQFDSCGLVCHFHSYRYIYSAARHLALASSIGSLTLKRVDIGHAQGSKAKPTCLLDQLSI